MKIYDGKFHNFPHFNSISTCVGMESPNQILYRNEFSCFLVQQMVCNQPQLHLMLMYTVLSHILTIATRTSKPIQFLCNTITDWLTEEDDRFGNYYKILWMVSPSSDSSEFPPFSNRKLIWKHMKVKMLLPNRRLKTGTGNYSWDRTETVALIRYEIQNNWMKIEFEIGL